MAEIIVALVGFAGSAIGAVAGIFINTKLMNYRIEQLENKVDKHNNLIERTYDIEAHIKVIDEKIEVANHRIKDLEEENHEFSDNKFVKEH